MKKRMNFGKSLYGLLLLFCMGSPFGLWAQNCSISGSSQVCQNSNENYTAQVQLQSGEYLEWSADRGRVSGVNALEATIEWINEGLGTVQATVFNSSEIEQYSCAFEVDILAAPLPEIVPDYIPRCVGGDLGHGILLPLWTYCEDSEVNFTSNGQANSQFSWSVTDDNNGNSHSILEEDGDHILLQFTAPGIVTICLSETNTGGCTVQQCDQVNVLQKPEALAEAVGFPMQSTIVICRGQDLHFLNLSPDPDGNDLPITLFEWTVTTPSTTFIGREEELTYHFDEAGTYTVALRVANCTGCWSDPYVITVNVNPGEQLEIVCPSVVCEGDIVAYSTTGMCDSYEWRFYVDGVQLLPDPLMGSSVFFSWSNLPPGHSGFGVVELIGINCAGSTCPEPSIYTVPIIPSVSAAINGPADICQEGGIYSYSLPNWPGASYNWSVNPAIPGSSIIGASTPRIRLTIPTGFSGNFTLQAAVDHPIAGCAFNVELPVTVMSVVIAGDDIFCHGEDPVFSVTPAYPIVQWTIRNDINTFEYIELNGTANQTFPANIFPGPGDYLVSVTLDDGMGSLFSCGNERLFTILPEVAMPSPIDGPAEACLNTNYLYAVDPVSNSQIIWNIPGNKGSFQNGNNTGSQVVVSWNTLPAKLRVRNVLMFGNKSCPSPRQTLDVTEVQIPDFSITGDKIVCTESVSDYQTTFDGGEDYQWTLIPSNAGSVLQGQGTNDISVQWHDLPAGTEVKLQVVVDACGSMITKTLDITLQKLIIKSGPEIACVGEDLNYVATDGGNGTIYTWDFGDGTPSQTSSSPQSPMHSFASSGVYFITVGLSNSLLCTTDQLAVFETEIVDRPDAIITSPDQLVCSEHGQPLNFPIRLYTQFRADYNYTWFGPNGQIPGNNSSKLEANEVGEYTVEIDNGVCLTMASYFIGCPTVAPGCTCPINLGLTTNVEKCSQANFIASINPFDPVNNTYQWSVPDPNDPNGGYFEQIDSPAEFFGSHTFTAPGFYWINLVADVNCQEGQPPCRIRAREQVTIPLIADFDWRYECVQEEGNYRVTFRDQSDALLEDENGIPITVGSRKWNAGAQEGNGEQYFFNFEPGQTVNVCLEITTTNGFTCTKCEDVDIPEYPSLSIGVDQNTTCIGNAFQFEALAIPAAQVASYQWDFGDGSTSTAANPQKTYNDANGSSHTVTLTINTIYGCSLSSQTTVTTVNNTLNGQILPDGFSFCPTDVAIRFVSQTLTPIETYTWAPGGENMQAITVNQSGAYSVTVSDASGCTFSPDPYLVVIENPFFGGIMGPREYCENERTNLTIIANPLFNYIWEVTPSNGPTITAGGEEFSRLLSPDTYSAQLVARRGVTICETINTSFIIHPRPKAALLTAQLLQCEPYEVELTASNPDNPSEAWGVFWSISGGTGIGFGSSISVGGGNYNALYIDENGCTSSTGIDVDDGIDFSSFLVGCYTLCEDELDGSLCLPGIPGDFSSWSWTQVGNPTPLLSGSGMVQDLCLQASYAGEIILTVATDNGCTEVSDPFCLEIENCECKVSVLETCTDCGEIILTAYDRYGNEIIPGFDANNIRHQLSWKIDGQPQNGSNNVIAYNYSEYSLVYSQFAWPTFFICSDEVSTRPVSISCTGVLEEEFILASCNDDALTSNGLEWPAEVDCTPVCGTASGVKKTVGIFGSNGNLLDVSLYDIVWSNGATGPVSVAYSHNVTVTEIATGCTWEGNYWAACCLLEPPVIHCEVRYIQHGEDGEVDPEPWGTFIVWNLVSGAIDYEVELTPGGLGEDCCTSMSGPQDVIVEHTNTNFYRLPDELDCLTARVRATCWLGTVSEWSEPFEFCPENTPCDTTVVTCHCGKIAGGHNHQLMLSEELRFPDVAVPYSLETSKTTSGKAPAKSVRVFPNPTTDQVYLETEAALEQSYRIVDLTGRVIREGSIPVEGTVKISLADYQGIFFLLVQDKTGNIIQTEKIEVMK